MKKGIIAIRWRRTLLKVSEVIKSECLSVCDLIIGLNRHEIINRLKLKSSHIIVMIFFLIRWGVKQLRSHRISLLQNDVYAIPMLNKRLMAFVFTTSFSQLVAESMQISVSYFI